MVSTTTGSRDVAVVADGEHSCMTMRGIRTSGSMRTSVMRGAFYDDNATRAELLNLIAAKK
jgi:GTP cyclohydrolase I